MTDVRSHLLICTGGGCIASGALDVSEAMRAELSRRDLAAEVEVVETGCLGPCVQGPVALVYPDGVFYQNIKVDDVPEIVEEHLLKGRVVERLISHAPGTDKTQAEMEDIPFFNRQVKIVLRNSGIIDPLKIDEYIAREGYQALAKVLTSMTPEQVVQEVLDSGLRGRGGAGFPTGMKWKFAQAQDNDVKYILCNADEGDPGAFMDRSVLEGDPHSLIEGMVIGAYAIGAHQGYVYVRAEYPLAVKRLRLAIAAAEELGYLGDDIFGSGWDFHLKIKEGAGAFVCGEETALIASIMGERGMPRKRPPFPAVSGLWGKPTNINNVETYATVPWIVAHGASEYAAIGSESCKGTKAFSLAGKVVNGGLAEVPMGSTLRHVIFDVGGGIKDGRRFKAVQLGGPSGGCVPAALLDTPVDYESLTATGAIMGSGGMVVADDQTCMVDLAKYFLQFTQNESCGKCVPCRLGTKRMLEILERITAGDGRQGDIETLEALALSVKKTSLCGLGQTAPNPVLTTIRYFRDEYEAHISGQECPAHACTALIAYTVEADLCTGCMLCAKKCPTGAAHGPKKLTHVIDQDTCIKCDACRAACKFDAVKIVSGPDEIATAVAAQREGHEAASAKK